MKRKIVRIFILSMIMLVLLTQGALGNDEYQVRVRIRYPRLYNEQTTLEGYGEITVYMEEEELFDLDNVLNLRMDTYYTGNYYVTDEERAIYGPYHVVIRDEVYHSFYEAKEEAEMLEDYLSIDFYPYLTEEGYIVGGGNFKDKSSANKLILELEDMGYEGETINGYLKNIIAFNQHNEPVFMYEKDMPIFFTSYNEDERYEMVKIDNRAYRGKVKLHILDSTRLLTINYVELENYLYGVVPNEIPSSWGIEALKAQAAAARTYAVTSINPRQIYDMEDNQNSQVYMGYDYEKPSTNRAVDETRGEKIYYDGELIQAFYHSTSGGRTENSENVWYEALPYLRGVEDEFSDKSGSPHSYWETTLYKEDIIRSLNLDGNRVNELYGIEIKEVSENNRVLECIFLTDAGKISYKKENVRLLLGLKSSWFTIDSGNSFYFIDEYVASGEKNNVPVPSRGILDVITDDDYEDSDEEIRPIMGSILDSYAITSNGTKKIQRDKLAFISSKGVSIIDTNSKHYVFSGRGWGHGIGMSQYGAKQMAEEGYSYIEILKHYYTGVMIK
ncbi:MAG TPA: SpoIID/LytB domain-containing protein [Tissierellia bacterium]|nr:SpoIID/LytB domain-containing protein [Tissierellia bacterium]